jgi:hypothetical protein
MASEPASKFGLNLTGRDHFPAFHVNASPKSSSAAQKCRPEHAIALPTFGSDPPEGLVAARVPAFDHFRPSNRQTPVLAPSSAMQN